MTCTVFILWLTGVIAFKIKEQKWMTLKIYRAGKLHKVIGYTFIFIGFFTCGAGIYEFGELYGPDYILVLARFNALVSLIVFAIAECWHRSRRNAKDPFVAPETTMTIKEFEEKIKQGQKLWILDNIIVDLSQYAHLHPGGSFVMERTIGADISKFFYGGYALDSNSNVIASGSAHIWNHTNIARKIVNQLAVARLVKDDTPCFKAKVSSQEALNGKTSCYTFKSDGIVRGISNYFPELEMLGQHYLVSSEVYKHEKLLVHRHYTIANCMIKSFYDQLCDSNLSEALKYEDTDELSLSIKNYNVGLSQRFSKEQDTYEIQGPMGKGLGLTKDSQGVYYAFAAGTGVLVFVDLIARILLGVKKFIPEEQRLHENFQLVMYASFQNRDDGIALKLMETLNEMNLPQFKLVLRFSDQKSPRWGKEFLDQ